MSESVEKPKRSLAEIHQEYTQLCAKAGHIQYNIHVMSEDLKLVNESLKNLNFEAAEAGKREREEAAKKAASEEQKVKLEGVN